MKHSIINVKYGNTSSKREVLKLTRELKPISEFSGKAGYVRRSAVSVSRKRDGRALSFNRRSDAREGAAKRECQKSSARHRRPRSQTRPLRRTERARRVALLRNSDSNPRRASKRALTVFRSTFSFIKLPGKQVFDLRLETLQLSRRRISSGDGRGLQNRL